LLVFGHRQRLIIPPVVPMFLHQMRVNVLQVIPQQ
jgi:hypothetical protein